MVNRTVLAVLAGLSAVWLLTGCAGPPDRTGPIPGNLLGTVFSACSRESGASGSFSSGLSSSREIDYTPEGVSWHVHVEDGQASVLPGVVGESATASGDQSVPDPSQPLVAGAVKSALRLSNCFFRYRFAAAAPLPAKQANLVMMYRWTVSVLWPCLNDHGFNPGPPPNRADFRTPDSALQVDPYLSPRLGEQPVSALVGASRYCAEFPEYLSPG